MTRKTPGPATAAELYKPLDAPTTKALHANPGATVKTSREPVQFRYQLAQYVAERRPDGWYTAKSWSTSLGEKPKWEGPFDFPEDAAIAIARYLCAELSNRHMSKARFHQVKPGQALYGLPPAPALHRPRNNGGAS